MSDYEKAVTTRLKTARGHLDGVIRMVEQEAYCPDVMKQLAAVQGLVEATSRMEPSEGLGPRPKPNRSGATLRPSPATLS